MSIPQLEQAILARLKATLKDVADPLVPLVREVYSQTDYTAIQERAMVTPSVALIYTGYHLGASIDPSRAIQEVGFDWLVVVNVRNAKNPSTGEAVRADAGPIFDAALAALIGWKPLPKFRPMKLEPAPGAALSDAGFGYYPIAFSTLGTYRGTPA